MVQEDKVKAWKSNRTWHHCPCGTDSVGVKDTRLSEFCILNQRQYVARLELLQRGSKRPLHKGVNIEPKLHWGLQNVGDVRTISHLPRKAMVIEWFQPKRGGMCPAGCRDEGTGLPKTLGAQLVTICTPNVGHRASCRILVFALLDYGSAWI